jgi:hypothetical protein
MTAFCGIFSEGEQEVAWLKDAGYGHLVSKMEGMFYLKEKKSWCL